MIWGQYFPESHSVNAGKFAYRDVFRRIFGCALLFSIGGTCLIHFAQQFLIVPSWVFSFFLFGHVPLGSSRAASRQHVRAGPVWAWGRWAISNNWDVSRLPRFISSVAIILQFDIYTGINWHWHHFFMIFHQQKHRKAVLFVSFSAWCLVLCCVGNTGFPMGWTPNATEDSKKSPRPKKERPSPLPDSFFSKEDLIDTSFLLDDFCLKVSQETKNNGEKETSIHKKSFNAPVGVIMTFHDHMMIYSRIIYIYIILS